MNDPFSISLADLAEAGIAASKRATEEAKDAEILAAGLLKKRRQRVRLKIRTVVARPREKPHLSRLGNKRGHVRLARKLRSAGG